MTLPINLWKCYYSCTLNSIDGFFLLVFSPFTPDRVFWSSPETYILHLFQWSKPPMIAKNNVAKAACVGLICSPHSDLDSQTSPGPSWKWTRKPLGSESFGSTWFSACLWRVASRCFEVIMVEQTCVCNMWFADVIAVDRAKFFDYWILVLLLANFQPQLFSIEFVAPESSFFWFRIYPRFCWPYSPQTLTWKPP